VSGGAELPLAYLTNATALLFTGPGRFSLDRALGIKVPTIIAALIVAGVAAGVAIGLLMREQPTETQENDDQATPSLETQTSSEEAAQLQEREVGAD
jgi:putative oxidoreductase